jgi:hypothetical protein
MPAAVPVTLATPPRRIHPAPWAWGAPCRALGDPRPRRDGQDPTQALAGVRRTAQRRRHLHARGGRIEDVCVAVTAPPIGRNGRRRGGGSTHHTPVGLTSLGPTQGPRDRATPRRGPGHLRPAAHRPSPSGAPRHWAAALALAMPPPTPGEPPPPLPTHPRPLGPQRRLCDPTRRRHDAGPLARPRRRPRLPPRVVQGLRHPTAGVYPHGPPARDGPATSPTRAPPQTGGLPPPRCGQGPRPAWRTPRGHGGRHHRTIAGVPRASVSLAPAGQPTHGALRPQGATMDRGDPGGEPAWARLEEAHHQPGQGLQQPPIPPLCLWASHLHQRLRETRCAVRVSPPGTTVIPTRVSPDLRRAGGHASRLSVNQPDRHLRPREAAEAL